MLCPALFLFFVHFLSSVTQVFKTMGPEIHKIHWMNEQGLRLVILVAPDKGWWVFPQLKD